MIDFIDNPPYIWTSDMKSAVEKAAENWGEIISSSVPVTILAKIGNISPSIGRTVINYTLGSNIPLSVGANTDARYPNALANSLAGFDLAPDVYDMEITFIADALINNPQGGSWYTGTDGGGTSLQYDLVTVAMHEIGHGFLGISNFLVNGGTAVLNPTTEPFPNILDFFLINCNAEPFQPGGPLPRSIGEQFIHNNSGAGLGGLLIGLTGGICWIDEPGFLDCIGDKKEEFEPSFQTVWGPGGPGLQTEFIAHLKESQFPQGDPNSMMTPITYAGEANHDPGQLFTCMLKSLGFVMTDYYEEFHSLFHYRYLPSHSHENEIMEIEVYDLYGNLIDFIKPSNQYGILSNRRLSSGIYFKIHKINGRVVKTEKLMVVK